MMLTMEPCICVHTLLGATPWETLAARLPQKSWVKHPALTLATKTIMAITIGMSLQTVPMVLMRVAPFIPAMTMKVRHHRTQAATMTLGQLEPSPNTGQKEPTMAMRRVAKATFPIQELSQ